MDLAQRASLADLQEWHHLLLQEPPARANAPVYSFSTTCLSSRLKLKNTLRWLMGVDQISELGMECYHKPFSPRLAQYPYLSA